MNKRLFILSLFVGLMGSAFTQKHIELYEYWFDNNAVAKITTAINPTTTCELNTTIPTTGLPVGLHTVQVRFKDNMGSWSSTSTQFFVKQPSSTSEDNKITKYEYWYDNNYKGKATHKVTAQTELSIVTDIAAESLPAGLHTFQIRFQSASGKWSSTSTQFFVKQPSSASEDNKITKYEYWFDNNYKGKTTKNVTAQTDLSLVTDIAAESLPVGLHTFQIRFQSASGKWSSTSTQFFVKQPSSVSEDNKITKYEYWFDNDYSGKTIQSVTAETDLSLVTNIVAESLPEGLHTFQIRFQSASGKWSSTSNQFFIRTNLRGVGENKIVAYEYWHNQSDNLKTRVDMTPVNPLELNNKLIEVSNLKQTVTPDSFRFVPDVHGNAKIYYLASNYLYIRFLDENGQWSTPSMSYFADGKGIEVFADTLYSNVPVTKTKPASDEIHFYKLNALKGDSLIWKTNQPCSIQVFDPFGVEVYKTSGSNALTFNGMRAKRDGVYYVLLHSQTTNSPQITLNYQHIHKYAVLGFSPNKVGNQGISSFNFAGNGFDAVTKVSFTNTTDTITPDIVTCKDLGNLSAAVDFTNKNIGIYDINLLFTDTTITIVNGLEVEEFKPIELDVSVIGPSNFRIGTPITYTITVKNKGNATAYQVPLNIKLIANSENAIRNLKLSDNIPKPEIPENLDLSLVNASLADSIRGYFENFQDIDHFMLFKDAEKKEFVLTNDFYITSIDPNSDITITVTLTTSTSVDIRAAIPRTWQVDNIENSNNSIRVKSNALCCIYNSLDCIISIAELYLPSTIPLDITCVWGVLRSRLGFAVSIGCDDSETVEEKIANTTIGFYNSVISSMLSCIETDNLNIFWSVVNKIKDVVNVGVSCGNTINSWLSGDCFPPPEEGGQHSDGIRSYDPNDKIGYRSASGSTYFKEDVTNMTYVINFENDPEKATAAAQDVYISDTLDLTKYDINSFRAGYVSVAGKFKQAAYNVQKHTWEIDMRPEMNLITRVNLFLDKEKGIANWHFASIDPMTDQPTTDIFAGFLPPNDSIGSGQGSVSFTIDLKDTIQNGSSVNNRASIVFDYNDAILTPTWSNTKDIIAPVSTMSQPSIASDSIATLSWIGEDNENGSGIYRYNIFSKKAGEDYSSLLANTSHNSVDFKFKKDTEYAFYVIATDSAGNTEVKANVPDITFSTTAIPKIQTSNYQMNVFPNPSTNGTGVYVNIDIPYEELKQSRLVITTLLGSVVKEIDLISNKTHVEDVGKGMFIFNLHVKGASVEHRKVVIQ